MRRGGSWLYAFGSVWGCTGWEQDKEQWLVMGAVLSKGNCIPWGGETTGLASSSPSPPKKFGSLLPNQINQAEQMSFC